MQRRSLLGLCGLAWLVSLLAATWGAGAAQQAAPAPPAFRHSTHVVKEWGEDFFEETFRDCRGCHRFGPDEAVSKPQAGCKDCHYGSGALDQFRRDERGEYQAGQEPDLGAFASRTRQGFRHHTHGMLQCSECHRGAEGEDVPDNIPIRTGPGECARCHERSQAEGVVDQLRWFRAVAEDRDLARACGLEDTFTIPTDSARYADRLDQVFAGEGAGLNALLAAGGGDFAHGDHSEMSCKDCHSGIPAATAAEVGTGAIDATACAECHQSASGVPNQALAPARSEPRPSWSLGAFAHADHFRVRGGAERKPGVCSESSYAPFEGGLDQTCQHCHVYDPGRAGFEDADFPFVGGEGSKHRYRDCQTCHAEPGWSTGELGPGRAPLHSSSGEGPSGWLEQRCDACHVFNGADMRAERPLVEVERWSGATFVFEGQTHPFITSAGGGAESVSKDCQSCHRAVVPSLPTRLIEKSFRHATHLPSGRALTNADCASCHKSAQTSGSSRALAIDYRTYDLAACAACHTGSAVVEDVEPDARPAARSTAAFPHKQHVDHLACSACHEVAGDGADVVTKPSAMRCNECHNHSSAQAAVPGLLDAGESEAIAAQLRSLHHIFDADAESCANCHHDAATPDIAAVPAIRGTEAVASDPRYSIQPVDFAGFSARQHHPLGGDCAQCHRANVVEGSGRVTPITVASANVVFAGRPRGRSFHGSDETSYASFERGGERVGCMSCHWKPIGAGSTITQAFGNYEPAADKTRDELGNRFTGWPGVQADGRVSK